MFSVKSHFLHSVWRGGAEWIQKFSHFIPKYGHVSQDVVNEILSKYCRLLLLLKHRSSALKTLGFLCKASQSVCCSEFSHNLTIWVYCGSSGTCAANVQARRRATGNCRKERPLASNRSERDFGLAHPPLPGMGRYEEKAPMSNHPMNKGLLACNSTCR